MTYVLIFLALLWVVLKMLWVKNFLFLGACDAPRGIICKRLIFLMILGEIFAISFSILFFDALLWQQIVNGIIIELLGTHILLSVPFLLEILGTFLEDIRN